ncbi:MAG: methyltransferase domain-containing protein [Candidatus Cloacimonetes bacterium]|nr:methyltransferase domain-containing protein [Candidatus Cloacimonadota bacterium]
MKNKRYKVDIENIENLSKQKNFETALKQNKHVDLLPEENVEDNLMFINKNAVIPKFNLQRPQRLSGLMTKLRKRFLLELRYATGSMIAHQNNFNQHIIRLFNGLIKTFGNRFEELNRNLVDTKEQLSNDIQTKNNHLENSISKYGLKIEKQASDISLFNSKLSKQKNNYNDMKKWVENNSDNLRNNNSEINVLKNNLDNIHYPKLNLNYKKFEDMHRGSESEIKKRQEQFLHFFHEAKEVLDIGCGRGEFIQALHEYGSGAYGIDIDKGMVAECKKNGLNVINQDAISHLKNLKDNKLDGIFCDQVLEHLDKKDIVEVIRLAVAKIKKGKFAIFSTPNVKNLTVITNAFYMDPTHITPLHPDTLGFLCEEAGFSKVSFIYYSEYSNKEKLSKIKNETMDQNIDKLNDLLFGAQDYAVVCQK